MKGINHTSPRHRRIASVRLLLLLLALLPFVGTATLRAGADKYDYVMSIDRSAVAVVDSNVVVSLQLTAIQDVPTRLSVILSPELIDTVSQRALELPMIFINSRNQQIYFERTLRKEYPDAMAFRKRKGEDLHIDYLRTVKYEPWMENAVLKLRKLSCACERRSVRGDDVVATFKHEVPQISLHPVYLLPPADNSEKIREEKGSAYLCFVVNKWDILPDYMNNPTELQKINNSVNFVRSDSNVTIRKMTVEGYASPEGRQSHNIMLSEKRTEALESYLQRTGMTKGIRMEAYGRGENWDGFLKYLREHSDVPQHSRILSIATNSRLTPDEREAAMRREAPEGYRYCLHNIFPSLRCTNYTVEYIVRPFTLEESELVFETRPINLNLNEIYRLAGKYSDNQEKYYAIIRKAYLLYPNDSYINLTMACLALKRGDTDEAEEFLTKVVDCPQKTMNMGIIAYLRGDLNRAMELVDEASRLGVPEAAQQLAEFQKLKN